MKLSVLGALVLTLLALGANSQIISIPTFPSGIRYPAAVTESGYWGDWSNVLSPYNSYLICGAEMRF